MIRPARASDGISIDLIALPLLFCLLAAVVGLFALAEEQPEICCNPPRCCEPPPDPRVEQLEGLISTAELLLGDQAVLLRKGGFAVALKETHEAQSTIDDLKKKTSLAQQVEAAEKAASLLEAQLKAKLADPPRPSSMPPQMPADEGFGTYVGPYVLLECREDTAIVHPGDWHISGQPADTEFSKLMDQIRHAGFVAFAVRPDGWFGKSFDKLKPRILRELGGTNSVGLAVFPIKANESIAPYLPNSR
jgi:hypothetical protein